MSRKISAEAIFDTIEVDLWGNSYTMRLVTQSVSLKLEAAQKKIQDLDEDETKADELARAMIETIDVMLEPADGAKTVQDLLSEMWEQDKLGIDWLTAFAQRLSEEANARRRPTSQNGTS